MTSLCSGARALAVGTALLLCLSPRASAFCRTISAPLPADFDQTASCYAPAGAIPLWWSNACIGFSVQQSASTQISLADAESHSLTAFQRWMGVTCAGGGNPSIAVSDEGPVACDLVQYSEAGPNQHSIIFRDTSWPYSDVYNTLALTTVTFDTDTGEIYDADIEVNTFKTQITLSSTPTADEYDFDSIITHEAGHFLGLAHTPTETAVMYALYKPASYALTSDDVAGICTIYAPAGTRATDQDSGTSVVPLSVQEAACDPTPRHGFGSACGSLVAAAATSGSSGCSVSRAPGTGRERQWPSVALAGLALGVGIARRRRAARVVR